MSYFIHNKYDSTSVAQLASMQSAGHTIIDYFGLLESGNTTYKNINTANMPCVVDNLETATFDTFEDDAGLKDKGEFVFGTSVIIKSIQRISITVGKNAVTKTLNNTIIPNKCSINVITGGGYEIQITGIELTSNTITVTSSITTSTTRNALIEIIEYQ